MARGPGNTKDRIDRHMLHEYLWKHRGRNDMMMLSVTELADKLNVTIFTMSKIFGEMREAGRVQKIGRKYQIFDPSERVWDHRID